MEDEQLVSPYSDGGDKERIVFIANLTADVLVRHTCRKVKISKNIKS